MFCGLLFCQFLGGEFLGGHLFGVDSGGMSLYVGEGHGDRLLPNLRRSATRIFGIYLLSLRFVRLLGLLVLFGLPVHRTHLQSEGCFAGLHFPMEMTGPF